MTSIVLTWIFRGCISKDNDKVLIKLKEQNKALFGNRDILDILDYGETDDDNKIDSVSWNQGIITKECQKGSKTRFLPR